MQDNWRFLELFGHISDEIIYQAGQPWKKNKHSRNLIRIASIVLIAALCLSAIFHSEVKAGIEKIITYIGEVLGIKEDVSSYADVLNKTIKKNDLSITLEEAILEQSELIVSYRIDIDEDTYDNLEFKSKVWINGKLVISGEFYNSERNTKDSQRLIECYRFDDTYVDNDTMVIKIVVTPLMVDQDREMGTFEYRFTASYAEIKADTTEIPLAKNLQVEEEVFKLQEFTLNGIESTITGSCEKIQDNWDYYIIGKDSLGNQVKYRLEHYYKPDFEFVLDKTDGYISPKSEWVDLQFYIHESQYKTLSNSENGDMVETDLYDTSNPDDMHPVGEKFKIRIKGE